MTNVAVTGISGLLGQRVLLRLDASPGVDRIVGLDLRDPERHTDRLEMHRVDIVTAPLAELLAGVEVLVHLAAIVDPMPDDSQESRVNVEGTRRVLDAAREVGVRKIVRVSTAAVYGAWANNPVPLTEAAPLRPNPGFGPAVQGAEVERLLTDWQVEHSEVVVTTLRAAPVLGRGAAHLWARLLAGRPAISVRGAAPPVQTVHADDVADAIMLAAEHDLPGPYNVAADGWLDAGDAAALRRRRPAAVPAEMLARALARLWSIGFGDVPAEALPYLTYSWVIANDRLRAAGWRPTHTNEETLIETVAALTKPFPKGRAAIAAGVVAGLAGAAAGGAILVRRSRSHAGGK
ncbi:MAG TPA: NAD-dependent epimerase/dehydratase family protein [Acidimicrobiia bacterium]|nr:NAD-dependent epimerase/dehydratase family protein [Acidimicrobiia bacterium]